MAVRFRRREWSRPISTIFTGAAGGMLAPGTLAYMADIWGVGIVMLIPVLGTCMVFVLVAVDLAGSEVEVGVGASLGEIGESLGAGLEVSVPGCPVTGCPGSARRTRRTEQVLVG